MQGVTVTTANTAPNFDISIHTPMQGVTHRDKKNFTVKRNFNPHSHAGSDLTVNGFINSLVLISIHTPMQGVTEVNVQASSDKDNFNPHSHAGSDAQRGVGHDGFIISIHTPMQGVTPFLENSFHRF